MKLPDDALVLRCGQRLCESGELLLYDCVEKLFEF